MRKIIVLTLLAAAPALFGSDAAKNLPKFEGGDLNKYWMDACAQIGRASCRERV